MIASIKNKKVIALIHVSIWTGYSFIVFTDPSMTFASSELTLKLALRSLFLNAILYYLNTYVLLPQLVGKKRYLLYFLSTLALLWCVTLSRSFTDRVLSINELRMEMFSAPHDEEKLMMPFQDEDPRFSEKRFRPMIRDGFQGPSFVFGSLSSLGILFLSTLFWVIVEWEKRNQREMALVNEKLVTEMKFLKSQINPHFLFNALNNVYSLSRVKSDKAPNMILKLSDMLRFILYESEDRKVKIGREIDYIENYIDFQKLKFEEEPRIVQQFDQIDRDLMIEPMLIIPFIENSFKHSKIDDLKNGWVSMELVSRDSVLYFNISNSLPASSIVKDGVGGIGIDNVRKRLSFLYPGKHDLKINCDDNAFYVSLVIDTR